jgi:hypothetical protein
MMQVGVVRVLVGWLSTVGIVMIPDFCEWCRRTLTVVGLAPTTIGRDESKGQATDTETTGASIRIIVSYAPSSSMVMWEVVQIERRAVRWGVGRGRDLGICGRRNLGV